MKNQKPKPKCRCECHNSKWDKCSMCASHHPKTWQEEFDEKFRPVFKHPLFEYMNNRRVGERIRVRPDKDIASIKQFISQLLKEDRNKVEEMIDDIIDKAFKDKRKWEHGEDIAIITSMALQDLKSKLKEL